MEKLSKRLYQIRQRCNNPKNTSYKRYGGRGIKALLTLKELKFLWKRDSAALLKCASVDRINNNGNYDINNCRFVELIDNTRKAASDKRGITLEEYNKNLKQCLECHSYNGYTLTSGVHVCRKCGARTGQGKADLKIKGCAYCGSSTGYFIKSGVFVCRACGARSADVKKDEAKDKEGGEHGQP